MTLVKNGFFIFYFLKATQGGRIIDPGPYPPPLESSYGDSVRQEEEPMDTSTLSYKTAKCAHS